MFAGTPPFGLTGFNWLSGGVVSKATAFPTTGVDTEAIVVGSCALPDALATRAARVRAAATSAAPTSILRISPSFPLRELTPAPTLYRSG